MTIENLSELGVWAKELRLDAFTNTNNRLQIPTELYESGWLRNQPVTGQHLNQLMYLITAAVPALASPYLQFGSTPDTGTLRCNGQTFNTTDNPILALRYTSGSLPNLVPEEPTGFIYVVRAA